MTKAHITIYLKYSLLFWCLLTTMTFAQSIQPSKQVSLTFHNTPIATILQALADYQQLNLVIANSVDGDYSLHLEQVSWQQALDALIHLAQLEIEIKDDIMFITSYEAKQIRQKQIKQQLQELEKDEPLKTLTYVVKFGQARQLANLLLSAPGTLLSQRGNILVEERSNTLVIRDLATVLPMAEQLLSQLDQETQQVQLMAHIVSMSSDSLSEMGVAWSLSDATNTVKRIGINQFNVSLPLASASVDAGLRIAKFDGQLLNLQLSAMEAENKAEIVASPHLLTADRQTASIKQGSEIPYEVTNNEKGTTSIEFKEAVLGLEVTPRILPNHKIEMVLHISQNTPGKAIKSRNGGEVLVIDTQEIQTQVTVGSGETLILGGVFQRSNLNSLEQVPLLGDIPWLGQLFRRQSHKQQRRELVIFITPKISHD